MKTIKELKDDYLNGNNISKIMRTEKNIDYNTPEIIEIAYELQTGTYQEKWSRKDLNNFYNKFTKEIAEIILKTCKPNSIMEAGVGEATTFVKVLKHLNLDNLKAFGFDISWSRVLFSKKLIENENIKNIHLCTGNLLDIPFLNSSIDLVYTFHSIEPNQGSEELILKELLRVTKKYLILFEPDYEGTNEENKKRMDSLGYAKGLKNILINLNSKIIYEGKFENNLNEKNPTQILIIQKDFIEDEIQDYFACPKYKTKLIKDEKENIYFSEEALTVYPILKGIPCLRKENGILTTKYEIE
ncbi:methyltransferase domain-containing protein [Aliarcobacter butzleri]|uniref:methyltransferase domain-containing protein n=1 Tax=Aliarcobacter butzleri TaxID=28197 RepID=UPI003B20F326